MTKTRNGILIFLSIIPALLTSCWNDFEERTYYSANVLSFSFGEHDVAPEIENYFFYIDNFNGDSALGTSGRIFNIDSLPFGTKVTSLFPAVDVQSTNGKFYFNDSIWDEETDSIDFSQPVILQNTSIDEVFTKKYTVYINVHQVNPDTMILEPTQTPLPALVGKNRIVETESQLMNYSLNPITGFKVYASSDTMRTWSTAVVTGLPASMNLNSVGRFKTATYALANNNQLFKATDGLSWSSLLPVDTDGNAVSLLNLFGTLAFPTDTLPEVLTGLMVTSAGDTCYTRSFDGLIWEKGRSVGADFPYSDYSVVGWETITKTQNLTAVGGLNILGQLVKTVWSTEDGLDWKIINNSRIPGQAPPLCQHATLFFYDKYLVSMGGIDAFGNYRNSLRVSPDKGVTWTSAPELWKMHKLATGISGAGVYIQRIPDAVNDKDREFIYLVGGVRPSGSSSIVWKAYLNSMVFARR